MKMPAQVKLMLELHKLETNGNGVDKASAFKKIKESLDPSLLKLYLRLRERRGTGTALLRNGMCSACMLIYPESHEILRYENTIQFCEFCGRLLVIAEEVA